MDVATVACNVCGRQKQRTNHWLVGVVKPGFEGILFQPAEACMSPRNPDFNYEDFCGQLCAHKRLDRWFEDLTNVIFPTHESEAA
jgi:endogenous inhibitor of DNA gyrase (YacG/DUF329 family)